MRKRIDIYIVDKYTRSGMDFEYCSSNVILLGCTEEDAHARTVSADVHLYNGPMK